jgi:hypothetical protein
MVSEPLTLHITWQFAPEDVATFYEVLRPLHENLVKEKECLYFNVYEIAQQPGIVRLVEMWDCDMKWMAEVGFLALILSWRTKLMEYRSNRRRIIMRLSLKQQKKLRSSLRRLRL